MSASNRQQRAEIMILREARAADREKLLRWRNDPTSAEMSATTCEISIEDHARWFRQRLDFGDIWIGVLNGSEDVGVVSGRLLVHSDPETPSISITVAPEWRGQGLSVPLITLGTYRIMKQFKVKSVRADIRVANVPSLRAFLKAGYKLVSVTDDRVWAELRYDAE